MQTEMKSRMKSHILAGALLLMAALVRAAAKDDAGARPKDTVDLTTSFKVANTNWVGQTLAAVLGSRAIDRIIVVDTSNSQMPVKDWIVAVKNLWKSTARLTPPPPSAELSVPISFLVLLKDGGLLKVQFEGRYGSLTSAEGVAYWKMDAQ